MKVFNELIKERKFAKGKSCYYNLENIEKVFIDEEDNTKLSIQKILYSDGTKRKISEKDMLVLSDYSCEYPWGQSFEWSIEF